MPLESQGVQAWDRYAYSYGNPVKYIDPDGHDPIPYDEFIKQAVNFFQNIGYDVIGNPLAKSIYSNGADLVAKGKEGFTVVAVELKNVTSVDLGTLGKNYRGDYGGSIDRVLRSASRFSNSRNEQLKPESKTITEAFESGNLQNALYTTASNVSDKAKEVFNNVYSNAGKTLGPAVAATQKTVQTGAQAAGAFISATETSFAGIFLYTNYNPYKQRVQ